MRELTIEEIKKIQMDILSYTDNFCRDNNIQYSISGGTLIGAVRHGGYIPWDDDIDIMMTRENFQKFESLFPKIADKQYRLFSNNIDKYFCQPYLNVADMSTSYDMPGYPKSMGVNIDIFPFDYISEDEKERQLLFAKVQSLRNRFNIKGLRWRKGRALSKNIFMVLGKCALLFTSRKSLSKQIETLALNAGPVESNLRACIVWGYGAKEVIPASLFDEYINIAFEDRTYMAIKDYKVYLTHLFGDFMQLPPVEKQVSHHEFKAYCK